MYWAIIITHWIGVVPYHYCTCLHVRYCILVQCHMGNLQLYDDVTLDGYIPIHAWCIHLSMYFHYMVMCYLQLISIGWILSMLTCVRCIIIMSGGGNYVSMAPCGRMWVYVHATLHACVSLTITCLHGCVSQSGDGCMATCHCFACSAIALNAFHSGNLF